jgi:CRISPR-associated protein Cmr6
MAVAAVPRYLQNDPEFYLTAPPGHRFLLYFPVWSENQETGQIDWRMKDRTPKIDKKTKAQKTGKFGPEWEDVPNDQFACAVTACVTAGYDEERPRLRKPRADPGLKPWKPLMQALLDRQTEAAGQNAQEALLRVQGVSTAPFTTGLGNEHPLENGFAFLNPYGLPYLPGSGVKGVLHQAARELATGEWGQRYDWSDRKDLELKLGETQVKMSLIDILFGLESEDGDKTHVQGILSFWDVLPQIAGDNLMVEIMTPHQSHYYQEKPQAGSIAPHESGQPNPISFLTVPPSSQFSFNVVCDLDRLRWLAPELATRDRWKTMLLGAFEHAFSWLGFGAKTAVGYGQMKLDQEAQRAREEAELRIREETARTQRLESLSPIQRAVEEALSEKTEKGMSDGVFLTQQLDRGRWQGEEAKAIAAVIRDHLKAEKKWKEKTDKPDKDKDYKRTQSILKYLQL